MQGTVLRSQCMHVVYLKLIICISTLDLISLCYVSPTLSGSKWCKRCSGEDNFVIKIFKALNSGKAFSKIKKIFLIVCQYIMQTTGLANNYFINYNVSEYDSMLRFKIGAISKIFIRFYIVPIFKPA